MRTFLILFLSLLISSLPLSAEADKAQFESLFTQGNEAFAQGQHTQAVELYEQAKAHGVSANLLNNLGTAYLQTGQSGHAIYAWRQALVLDSNHAEAFRNLENALKEKGLSPYNTDWFAHYYHFFTVNQWGVAAIGIFWLAIALIAFSGGRVRRNPALLFSLIVLASLFTACIVALGGYHLERNDAIILHSGVELKVAPNIDSPAATSAREGEKLRISNTRKNYVLLESSDGRKGWAEKKDIGKIWE